MGIRKLKYCVLCGKKIEKVTEDNKTGWTESEGYHCGGHTDEEFFDYAKKIIKGYDSLTGIKKE